MRIWGVWEGWSHRGQIRRASPEPGIEHVWFLGCCDASDAIDGEAMQAVFYQGWDFMLIRKGETTGPKSRLDRLQEREMRVSGGH